MLCLSRDGGILLTLCEFISKRFRCIVEPIERIGLTITFEPHRRRLELPIPSHPSLAAHRKSVHPADEAERPTHVESFLGRSFVDKLAARLAASRQSRIWLSSHQ